MIDDTQQAPTGRLFDRSDERVKHADTLGSAIGAFVDRVRSGLAGLLGWLGLQLYLLGSSGSINLPYGSPLVNFGQMLVMPPSVLWVGQDWPVAVAIATALVLGAAIGALYAFLFNRLGMPSFVSTLRLPDGRAPAGGGAIGQLAGPHGAEGTAGHHRARIRHLLSQSRARHSLDVRSVRRPVRGHELRIDSNQMGPLDVCRRR
ncbi:hypothetical protein ACVI1J_008067 [Bradyrhizobium diazoefficiens]